MRRSRFLAPLLIATLLGVHPATARASVGEGRPGAYVLELEGSAVGFLHDATGGDPEADEIVTPNTITGGVTKRPGAVRYSELVLDVGVGMEPAVYDWIGKAWASKATPASGAVLATDFNLQVVRRKEFFNGLVTETALPAFDGGSKDPVWITVRVRPERTRMATGGGSIPSSLAAKGARPLLSNGFRLEIPGLDCSRVRKIGPLRIGTKVAYDAVGTARETNLTPTTVEVSDLAVTLPEASADSWYSWLQTFVVQGKGDESQEKNGDLVLVGPDGQSEIARIHLFNLGILSLATETTSTASAIRSVTARLYCERATLEWKGGEGAVLNVRTFGRSDE